MSTERGRVLLAIARTSISVALGRPQAGAHHAPWLDEPGATFVTLMQGDRLRGCIGTLQARRSLRDDVSANAVAAALRDPRFPALGAHELGSTDIEVSLLSAMETIDFDSEADALARLRPGIDGVVLEFGQYRSTFLPQVWEQLDTAAVFMAQLKRKAGLAADFWSDALRLQRYTVGKWKETDGARSPGAGRPGERT